MKRKERVDRVFERVVRIRVGKTQLAAAQEGREQKVEALLRAVSAVATDKRVAVLRSLPARLGFLESLMVVLRDLSGETRDVILQAEIDRLVRKYPSLKKVVQ